jgi:hypothetical protein
MGALAGVDAASLPGAAPGVGLLGAMDIGANRFELQALAWLPKHASLAGHTTVGGDIGLYAGALRYCRGLFDGVLDLAPCAGLEAGALVATNVVGLSPPRVSVGPWIAPELGVMGVFRASARFVVSLEVDGLVALEQPQFVVTSAGSVFQPRWGTGRVLLALHVRFP